LAYVLTSMGTSQRRSRRRKVRPDHGPRL